MSVYDIGIADIYIVSLISAADADRIVAVTGKRPRYDSQQIADRLNWAVTLAIAGTSAALAGPSSEHRQRANRLHAVLGQALQLMGLDPDRAPRAGSDFAGSYAVLLPEGETPSAAAASAKLGFPSTRDAIWQGIRGLFLFRQYAATARAYWEAHPEKTRHKPDPFFMVWAQAMVATYPAVVEGEVPRFPTTESPFIKFCEEIRAHLVSKPPADHDPALDAFWETLKRVHSAAMAAFVTRHFKRSP